MIEPLLTPRHLRAVLRRRPHARPLPRFVYTDPRVFALEARAVLPRAWLPACREEDVALPGSFVRPTLPWDVVVVRGEDLELRAFFNVCRHRGAPLVDDASRGRITRLPCPYHGWSYDLSGRLREGGPSRVGRDIRLESLEVSVQNGFVLCRVRGRSAQPPLPPWLAETELRPLRSTYRRTWITAANWKLVVENFQESAHFTTVHPSLERLTPRRRSSSIVRSGPWLGGRMELAPGVETVSSSGTRCGRPFVAAPPYRGAVHDALLFPLLLTSLQPDYLLTYTLQPLAPDATRIAFDILVHPEAAGDAVAREDLVSFWDRVNDEDRRITEAQQRVASAPVTLAPFDEGEDGVHAFQRRVARAYAKALGLRRAVDPKASAVGLGPGSVAR